jgi:polysaccharide pyruvyl transferase WcaK-like protein
MMADSSMSSVDARAGSGPTAMEKDTSDAVETAYAEALALADDAAYERALERLREVADRPGVLKHTQYVFLMARLLRATSRYQAARDVLQLAHRDGMTTGRAGAEESQIAWVQHDYAGGIAAAMHGLRAQPTNRAARASLKRLRQPTTPTVVDAPKSGIAHAAFYVSDGGNYGDVVLPLAVRDVFDSASGRHDWVPVHVHQLFDEERLEIVNAQRCLVVGGGGLFLPDTAANGNSGWQWNVPPEMLERVDVPLAAFAVGYNLFPGQQFQGDLFRKNLIAFAERAEFVGLRNNGSVERVRSMLPASLHEKVRFVPCPTTILSHIHGGLVDPAVGTRRVFINAAFDRSTRRFGSSYDSFLAEIEKFLASMEALGSEVRFASHVPKDERLVEDLAERYGRIIEVDAFYNLSSDDGMALYRKASLVVGMRGHATMIPFGLGTPVLSIVSHPKMRYFLEDIGRPEWAVDVDEPNLCDRLLERAVDIIEREAQYREDISDLQLPLRDRVLDAARDLEATSR